MAETAVLHGFAEAVLDPDRPVPPGLVARAGADPGRRLGVYRNNVAVGLIDTLRAGFPVTARIVGEAFFRAMARAYVAARMPASPLLVEYGDGFPGFVAGFAPAASVPYLAGVAALEVARVQALHAAEAPVVDPAALARLLAGQPGAALLGVGVEAHPAARVAASAHPAVSIWAAHRDGAAAPVFRGPWRPETALVTRPEDDVRVRMLDAAGGMFATALLAGASVGDAGAAALAEEGGFDVGGALVALADAGAIIDVTGAVR